jgi:hypothetical protein
MIALWLDPFLLALSDQSKPVTPTNFMLRADCFTMT